VQGGNELTKMNEIIDNCGYFIIIYVLVFDHFRHWNGQGLGTVRKLIEWMAKVYLGDHEWLFANVKNVGIMNKSANSVVILLGGDVKLQ
jgi:hypothetical protein